MSMEHESFKALLGTIQDNHKASLTTKPEFQQLFTALDKIGKDDWTKYHLGVEDAGITNALTGLNEILSDTKDNGFKNKFICDLIDLYDPIKTIETESFQNIAKALDAFIETYPKKTLSAETLKTINTHRQSNIKSTVATQRSQASIELLMSSETNNVNDTTRTLMTRIKELIPSDQLTDDVTRRIEEINRKNLTKEKPIELANQSNGALRVLLQEINKKPQQDAAIILNNVSVAIRTEDEEAKKRNEIFSRTGSQSPLYQTDIRQRALMHDADMTAVMPKSFGDIEVLAPLSLGDSQQQDLIKEAILATLKDPKIKHIFIPIGPGHWRGVYLRKPESINDSYHLEIFDSFGKESAEKIQKSILNIIGSIFSNPIELHYSGPTIQQKDGYSCGDYVCAYSHQKMLELNSAAPVNQALIDTLAKGNAQGELREVTRKVSGDNSPPPAVATSPNTPTAQPTAPPPLTRPPMSTKTPPPSFPDKESFKSQLQKFPVKKGWRLALDDNHKTANEYIIQSIDEKNQVHRDRDVLVTPGKVSATLSDTHDMAYKQELAAIMIEAAVISGIPVDKIEVKCEDAGMCAALQAEIDRRLKASLSSDDTEEIVLAPISRQP